MVLLQSVTELKRTQEPIFLSDVIDLPRAFGEPQKCHCFYTVFECWWAGRPASRADAVGSGQCSVSFSCMLRTLHQPPRASRSSHGIVIPFVVRVLIQGAGVRGQQDAALSHRQIHDREEGRPMAQGRAGFLTCCLGPCPGGPGLESPGWDARAVGSGSGGGAEPPRPVLGPSLQVLRKRSNPEDGKKYRGPDSAEGALPTRSMAVGVLGIACRDRSLMSLSAYCHGSVCSRTLREVTWDATSEPRIRKPHVEHSKRP